ncbi:MAG: hypothetical protein VKL39_21460, partial [Leptolyngbyaceae bacterium]|nr:hypothetical protein [Leptolyngbyaceae bacterium]
HISVYDLTIESGTAFNRWYEPGENPLPSDDTTAAMYRLTRQILTDAGYEHYEVSNYAKPGYACRHNQVYWHNQPYYGFGMGATSYVGGQRVSRPRTRADYATWVTELVTRQGIIDHPVTTSEEALLDTLMLGLRLAEGIELEALRQQFGDRPVHTMMKVLTPHIQKGWVTLEPLNTGQESLSSGRDDNESPVCSPGQQIRLTDPEGFLFSNVVLSDLFSKLSDSKLDDSPQAET